MYPKKPELERANLGKINWTYGLIDLHFAIKYYTVNALQNWPILWSSSGIFALIVPQFSKRDSCSYCSYIRKWQLPVCLFLRARIQNNKFLASPLKRSRKFFSRRVSIFRTLFRFQTANRPSISRSFDPVLIELSWFLPGYYYYYLFLYFQIMNKNL